MTTPEAQPDTCDVAAADAAGIRLMRPRAAAVRALPSRAIPPPPPAPPSAAPVTPASGAASVAPPPPPRFAWLTRARRVLLVLAAVWVLNFFDLGFTLVESSHGHFTELNPIAASILSRPDYFLITFKLGLLTLGSIILLVLREHRLAELGCWLLLAAYVYVGARWYAYYYCLLDGGRNSFVEVLAVLN